MEIYNVGKDEATPYNDELDESKYVWLIVDYEAGDYDGGGTAIALGIDGNLYEANLGHCSCFGPFEGGWSGEKLDWDRIMQTPENIFDTEYSEAIRNKVKELLGK